MNMYWSQRKVYLYGLVALFPYKLTNELVNEAEKLLGGKLNEVRKVSARDELIKYLSDYRQDRLSTGNPTRPENYQRQYDKLVTAIQSQFPKYGYRPIIGEAVGVSTFWELIFTHQLITQDIELVNIGYDRPKLDAGIYVAREVPFAEFEVVKPSLKRLVVPTPSSDTPHHKATLSLKAKNLWVYIDGKPYKLWSYKSTRSNSHKAISALFANPDQELTQDRLGLSTDTKTVIKDIPNNIGFVGVLRELFIELSYSAKEHKSTIQLHKSIPLNNIEYSRLMAEIVKRDE